MIDASIIKAHQHAAGAMGGQEKQSLRRSCGGFSSKIYAKVEALGMSLGFILTGGQRQEGAVAKELICEEVSDYLLADRGYDHDALREACQARGTIPVIPGKKES